MAASPSPTVHRAAGPDLTLGQLHAFLQLRVAIFVVEQECPYQEVDGRDLEPETQHVWIEDETGVVAYIRILSDREHGPDARRIGRVVTRHDRRGEQLAAHLIRASLDQMPGQDTRLEAQSHLVNYYRTFGYQPDGPEFIEDGIPHTPMLRLALTKDGASS